MNDKIFPRGRKPDMSVIAVAADLFKLKLQNKQLEPCLVSIKLPEGTQALFTTIHAAMKARGRTLSQTDLETWVVESLMAEGIIHCIESIEKADLPALGMVAPDDEGKESEQK